MKFIRVDKEEDITQLKQQWITLEKGRDMTIFQSYEWNLLLYRHWHKELYNRIFSQVVIGVDDETIIPLVIQKRSIFFKWMGRKKGIYVLGNDSYSDYLNLIYDNSRNNIKSKIWQAIKAICKEYPALPFYLSRIREDTLSYEVLCNMGVKPISEGIAVGVHLENYIQENDVDGYTGGLSKSNRQNLRTALNRMKRDGINYSLEVKEGPLENELIQTLLPIHLNRVLEINSKHTNIWNRMSNYFRRKEIKRVELNNNIVVSAMKQMMESVTVLVKCNNDIAGYLFGFREENKIRIIQNCVKSEYKFYSPMFRGTYDYICKCILDNILYVDFTRGGEEYKYKLGGIAVKLNSYAITGHYIDA